MSATAERPAALRPTDAGALTALLDLSPDAVVVTDRSGHIRRANEMAAGLFRFELDALLELTVEALVPSQLRELHQEERAGFYRQPSRRSMGTGRTLRARRRDGTTFPVDISLQPVLVDDEPLVVAVVRDLTSHDELRRRNDQLAHDADMLRRFVDVASHELRTPLTAVLGFAETLLEQPGMAEEVRADLVDRLARNARRQEALISGLLDLSRLHSGKLPVSIERVDLAATVQEVVGAFDEVEIHHTVPAGSWTYADELRIEQVLTNLLTNAVRYGAEPIHIDLGQVDGDPSSLLQLTVRDEGPGIAEDFEERIFEAFSQQSVGDRRDANGLGLGLYLSRELMLTMGGTLTYRRNEPSGSCFDIRLPAA